MNKAWITHLPHFLDVTGNILENIPLPARRLAKSVCAFVAYATSFEGEDNEELPQCFVAIKKKRCKGKALPLLTMVDDNIGWRCNTCESYGIISGWQGTLWDLSERADIH